jgi:hypothetical protein
MRMAPATLAVIIIMMSDIAVTVRLYIPGTALAWKDGVD